MLGPLGHVIRVVLVSKLDSRNAVFLIAKPNRDDLVVLRDLIEAGEVVPAIGERFELARIDEAMRDGRPRPRRS
jgi:hypothetical protein